MTHSKHYIRNVIGSASFILIRKNHQITSNLLSSPKFSQKSPKVKLKLRKSEIHSMQREEGYGGSPPHHVEGENYQRHF